MSIESILARGAADAVHHLYGTDVDASLLTPTATRKEFKGDMTIVVFPILKISRKAPDATATEIGNWMVENLDAVE